MPFYRPVQTGPLAELVSYVFAAAEVDFREKHSSGRFSV
jgi:hypothetical protein